MRLVEKMQETLKVGRWVFDDLGGSYQNLLSKKTNSDSLNKSISELCLSYYQKLPLMTTVLNSKTQGLYDLNCNQITMTTIQNLFSAEYPTISVGNFDALTADKLKRALFIVQSSNKAAYSHITENITLLLRVKGVSFRSASHPHLFGVILIGDGIENLSSEQAAVSIVHELAHQELFLINLADRLVNASFDYNEIHAPFQGKKRPPIGRLHSLWALYRMIDFQMASNNVNSKYVDLLSANVRAFDDGELTDIGKVLVNLASEQAS